MYVLSTKSNCARAQLAKAITTSLLFKLFIRSLHNFMAITNYWTKYPTPVYYFTVAICCNTLKRLLKLVSTIFYQIFIFSPNYSSSKTMKCFLFHLKSSFRSQDIQIFVIFLFLFTLSRFKRTNGSGIIYDVMNWLA